MLFPLFFSLLLSQVVCAQFASATNFWPAAYPLAVRSPYLNTWGIFTNGTTSLSSNWPYQWDFQSINGWSGWIRVDGTPYLWLGAAPGANQTVTQSSQVTPTRSIFVVNAGPVQLNITFLSPIEPNDLVKQSLPFSYLAVDVQSVDGNAHSIQLYSDISAEWISGTRSNIAKWNTTQTSQSVYHQAHRKSPQFMQETVNMAEDGFVYYGMRKVPNLTWQSGRDIDVRGQFATQGTLNGTSDPNFRAINNDFVVFGLSVDLGTITASFSSVVWGIGLVRDPVILYGDPDSGGSQNRSSYFWTQYSQISDAIDDFLADFSSAFSRAVALDQTITNDAQATTSGYADLVSLGARQTLAGIDFTISRTSTGGFNTSDVKAFMRDTGNTRGANTVTTLYAAMPALLYLNATWVGMLLSPLLQYQASSSYPNQFATTDLGQAYPQALGDSPTDGTQGIEDTGDMLIMTWAYTCYTGTGDLINIYYKLLKGWADYLVSNTLYPNGQLVDGLTKANMTNLAIKGIIGIRAFASIASAAGQNSDANLYLSTAQNLTDQWASNAFVNNEILSTYNPSSSFALIYNLYADVLLGFELVNASIYTAQTNLYLSKFGQAQKFGFPVDSDQTIVKTHWTMFTAGTTTTSELRNELVSMVRTRANDNLTSDAFPSTYDDSTGNTSGPATSGQASPQQGGMFAILALSLPNATSITIPPPSSPGNTSSSSSSLKTPSVLCGIVFVVSCILKYIA